MEINKILVPVDFSESSINALNWACNIAEKLNAEIILFHAFEIKKSFYENESFNDTLVLTKDLKDEKKERLKELALQTGYKKKLSFEYIAESGSFIKKVKEIIATANIEMVIMGTAGAEDAGNYFFGSNATELLRKNSLPLLIVPQKKNVSKINHIVFATTYSIEDLEPILFLSRLSALFKAKLTLLHIAQDDLGLEENRLHNYRKLIDKNTPGKTIHYDMLYNETILDGLNEYVKMNNIDLIGVNHRIRHGFFDDFLNPGLSEDLGLFTYTPLIVFSTDIL